MRKKNVQQLNQELYSLDFVPSYSIKDFHSKHRDLVEGTKADAVNLIGEFVVGITTKCTN